MKIVADENLLLLDELFSPLGEIIRLPGRQITTGDLEFADILLVRSVTQVNQQLVEKASSLKFVGSATIGTDHIDQSVLEDRGVKFAHAPGCNAEAVADYIVAAIAKVDGARLFSSSRSIGIVGYGNVGQAVHRRFKALGYQCRINDPFRHESFLHSLEDVLCCDIVSLHVPLSREGKSAYPSFHLINSRRLANMNPEQLLINTSRGSVIEESALLDLGSSCPRIVLDVWENEPQISTEIFKKASLGTPHIAGYSQQGKERGSYFIYRQLTDFFNIEASMPFDTGEQVIDSRSFDGYSDILQFISEIEPLDQDMKALSSVVGSGDQGKSFDQLRKHYRLRNEFSRYQLNGSIKKGLGATLTALGFTTQQEA